MNKKYDNFIDEWFDTNHNWKIFLGIIIGEILIGAVAFLLK